MSCKQKKHLNRRYINIYPCYPVTKAITDLKYLLAYSAQSEKPLLFLHIVSFYSFFLTV